MKTIEGKVKRTKIVTDELQKLYSEVEGQLDSEGAYLDFGKSRSTVTIDSIFQQIDQLKEDIDKDAERWAKRKTFKAKLVRLWRSFLALLK